MRPFILILLACSPRNTTPETTPPPVNTPVAEVPEAEENLKPSRSVWKPKAHMDQHFTFASDALFGLIQGDLSEVKAQAIDLTEHETAEAPKEWAPRIDTMLAASRKLEDASTLEEAATDLMDVVKACADCHQAVVGPDVSLKGLVADHTLFGEGLMERHEWAVYRMWMGLIVPDADIHDMGATGLTQEKGTFPEFPSEVQPLQRAVIEGGYAGLAAKTDAERRANFASLVPTCANCHTQLNVVMK